MNTGSNLSRRENITVNFYLEDADTEVYSAVTNLYSGAIISEPSAPAKPGYMFTGWNISSASDPFWNFSTDTVSGYTKLYANWSVNPIPTLIPTSTSTSTSTPTLSPTTTPTEPASSPAPAAGILAGLLGTALLLRRK